MDRTRRQTGLRAHWCIAFALFLGAVVSMCRGGQWDGQISLQLAMDGLALFGGGGLQRGWPAGPAGRGWPAAAVQDQQAWVGSPRAVAQGGGVVSCHWVRTLDHPRGWPGLAQSRSEQRIMLGGGSPVPAAPAGLGAGRLVVRWHQCQVLRQQGQGRKRC